MRKILLIILFGFTVSNCKSQLLNTTPNSTNPNTNVNKFVGTWVWAGRTEKLTLIFKKENILLPVEGNIRADVLYGFHKFTIDSVEIEDSTQYSATTYNDRKSTLLGYTLENLNLLEGGVTHISKNNKNVRYEIEYIDATHIKLLNLKNAEGIRINTPGQPPYDHTISLPQNIILTKQRNVRN